jgi:hypothetical protein
MPSNRISTNGNIYGFNSNSNTFHQPLIKWKGKTFNQIFASLKKNTYLFNTLTSSALMRPLPQKLYRKEFASIPSSSNTAITSQRVAVKLNDLNSPNGYSISAVTDPPVSIYGSLTTTLDINYVNNRGEHPYTCNSFSGTPCMVAESNAKRRVRSGGMYPKKFNPNRNNDSIYHSSTRDYLISRSKTFEQNQYNYFRNGDNKNDKPGQTHQTYFNDYSAQGISHCLYNGDSSTLSIAKYPHKLVSYKPKNWKFATQGAVDSSGFTSLKKETCEALCSTKYPPKKFPPVQTILNSCRRGKFVNTG